MTNPRNQHVWIDTDLSVGMQEPSNQRHCDVDDGYAILQLMNADTIDLIGISTVFGNTSVDNAFALAQHMSDEFSNSTIPVYKGAEKSMDLSNVSTNPAVEALAAALKKSPLTILAIGPATNIGLLLLKYPELSARMTEVVLVAGRRTPTDYFTIGNKGVHARDLNFDLDNNAFRVLLEAQVPVVLCPFEVSSKVWITQADLETIKTKQPVNQWLAQASEAWLQQWQEQGARGFNPFDVLASHYIIAPDDLQKETLKARLEIHLDDTKANNESNAFKQYLLCDESIGYPVTYCYDVATHYHTRLMESLQG